MGIHNQILAGLETAWTALAELLEPITVQRVARAAYSPSTGKGAETVISVPGIVAAVFDVSESKINGTTVRTGDLTCIIRAKDLAISPVQDDRVVRGDGSTWTVAGVRGNHRYYHELTLRIG